MFVHGKSTSLKIDDSGGTPLDVSSYAKQSDIGFPIDTHDVTTFGNNSKVFQTGLKGGDDITVDFLYDVTLEAFLAALYGNAATSTIDLAPAGRGAGTRKYTCEAYLKSFKPGIKVQDV